MQDASDVRIFKLLRDEDKSGISGIGFVAVGVVFPSRKVVVEWLGPHSTFGIYNNLTDVERIHGHGGTLGLRHGLPHCGSR